MITCKIRPEYYDVSGNYYEPDRRYELDYIMPMYELAVLRCEDGFTKMAIPKEFIYDIKEENQND